jgi:phytoene dehydrogenase-like protein
MSRRAAVIGGGVESLVAATCLAQAGVPTVLIERRDELGGVRAPWPAAPASRVSLVFDDAPSVNVAVARRLRLEGVGLAFERTPRTLAAIDVEGRPLVLSSDREASARAIASMSPRDAEAFAAFHGTLDRLARVLAPLVRRAPPREPIDPGGAWTALRTGGRYLGLDRRDAYALVRWPPMSVADLADEWFEHERLRTLVATKALFGVFAGPRSAGTAAVLVLRAAADGGLVPDTSVPRGGSIALVEALAARVRSAGVEVRLGVEARRVTVERGAAAGVELADGSHLRADVVLSGLDPRRTLLDLVEPEALAPDLAQRAAHIRARGTMARVLLAVDALPAISPFQSHGWPDALHVVSSVEELERGFDAVKYGAWREPLWLELAARPPGHAEGARSPGVLSVTVHRVPPVLRGLGWPEARDPLADAVLRTLEPVLPGLSSRLVARHVLTPADFERELGLTGGHPWHAELALDQLWVARPALGLGGYRTPITGLYLCGPGTHPGVGPLGTSGFWASRTALAETTRAPRPDR